MTENSNFERGANEIAKRMAIPNVEAIHDRLVLDSQTMSPRDFKSFVDMTAQKTLTGYVEQDFPRWSVESSGDSVVGIRFEERHSNDRELIYYTGDKSKLDKQDRAHLEFLESWKPSEEKQVPGLSHLDQGASEVAELLARNTWADVDNVVQRIYSDQSHMSNTDFKEFALRAAQKSMEQVAKHPTASTLSVQLGGKDCKHVHAVSIDIKFRWLPVSYRSIIYQNPGGFLDAWAARGCAAPSPGKATPTVSGPIELRDYK